MRVVEIKALLEEGEQGAVVRLMEEVKFDQLFRLSEPKRVLRSRTVRGPALDVRATSPSVKKVGGKLWYIFNLKSFPSTTGLRHHGYVMFKQPGDPNTPLEKCMCKVDCECPDYKFVYAWANKQRGASDVGASSLNKAWNKAPKIRNPGNRPGLCKHLLSLRDFIYGHVSTWPTSGAEESFKKLSNLFTHAEKRWGNFSGELGKAQEREKALAAARDARRQGEPTRADQAAGGLKPTIPPTEVTKIEEPVVKPPKLFTGLSGKKPEPVPTVAEPVPVPQTKTTKDKSPAAQGTKPKPKPGGGKREESAVDKEKLMKIDLTESKAIIRKMMIEDDTQPSALPEMPVGDEGGEIPGGDEGGGESEEVTLLRDISANIERMAQAVAPVDDGKEPTEADLPPEPEKDEKGEGEDVEDGEDKKKDSDKIEKLSEV